MIIIINLFLKNLTVIVCKMLHLLYTVRNEIMNSIELN